MSDMKRITIEDNEEFLRQISKEVDFNDKSYLEDIKKLEEYFIDNHSAFAMAAIQIGIPKRIIYIRNTTLDTEKKLDSNYNESKILINPVITYRKGLTRFLEGCESCLDYCGIVERPYQIEVEYYTIKGERIKEVFTGPSATIISHENDHLNGVLHMDIAIEVIRMTDKEKKKYRNEHPYEIIDKDYIWDEEKEDNKKFVKE